MMLDKRMQVGLLLSAIMLSVLVGSGCYLEQGPKAQTADPSVNDAGKIARLANSGASEEGKIAGAHAGDSTFVSITPFTNVASTVLKNGFEVWNGRPGVAVFDYDRDGDLDFYLTAEAENPNWLYRNEGDGTFTDVASQAGVEATDSHSTGVVACDINNDGYQDLYVGAWGNPWDDLDFRSPSEGQGNKDSLFLNRGDGTFLDITDSAFGEAVNLRSATSIACADVDSDGWVDIYVGNLSAQDFRRFTIPSHPGHSNMLYLNNGDLTFTEIGQRANVRGGQILMRDRNGKAVLFKDPETGVEYEGWDPTATDRKKNQIGEPTGQTHAVLFFDYDDDGDPDLWLANDGDRFHVYRNDSSAGEILFTPVAGALNIDKVGSWMGFAVGDYDGDADLDVFVTNIGYHPRLEEAWKTPGGSCEYHDQFAWGTCLHYLLRNDGVGDVPEVGTTGVFTDVAESTDVSPSPWMPPESLDISRIHTSREVPTGLGAYDFGFGTTFLDYDNDGFQDLYWLGSLSRGEGPGGFRFPAAGRMLRGDGHGSFEDITVRSHMLDIVGVIYPSSDGAPLPRHVSRISVDYHEDGRGLAHGDLNGDGYVDLIGTNSDGAVFENPDDAVGIVPASQLKTKPSPGPVFVWLNGGGGNHWLILRLRGRMAVDGTGSSADAIGARVYLKTTPEGGGISLVQVQEVRAGSSYLSMDSIDLEFGLGKATVVDEVTIRWPSGRTQILEVLPVDRLIVVTEPES